MRVCTTGADTLGRWAVESDGTGRGWGPLWHSGNVSCLDKGVGHMGLGIHQAEWNCIRSICDRTR